MSAIQVKCPSCGKLLFEIIEGLAVVVTVCPRCKAKVSWPDTTRATIEAEQEGTEAA